MSSGIALAQSGAPPPTGSARDPRSPLNPATSGAPATASSLQPGDTADVEAGTAPVNGHTIGNVQSPPPGDDLLSPPPPGDGSADPINPEPIKKSVVADYDYPNVPDTVEGQAAGTDPAAGGELAGNREGAFHKLFSGKLFKKS